MTTDWLGYLERRIERAPTRSGHTRAGKAALLRIIRARRTGMAAAGPDREERAAVHEAFLEDLDALSLEQMELDRGPEPLWSKDAVDQWGAFMIEKVKAQRARGRGPEASWEITSAGKTFHDWHTREAQRIRELADLGRRFSKRDDTERLKRVVVLLEHLQARLGELDLVWWPTMTTRGGVAGSLVDLARQWRIEFDDPMVRGGAYARQAALPMAPPDEIPL